MVLSAHRRYRRQARRKNIRINTINKMRTIAPMPMYMMWLSLRRPPTFPGSRLLPLTARGHTLGCSRHGVCLHGAGDVRS
jgi:hypothetical protein